MATYIYLSCEISILKSHSTVSVFHHYDPAPEKNDVKGDLFSFTASVVLVC